MWVRPEHWTNTSCRHTARTTIGSNASGRTCTITSPATTAARRWTNSWPTYGAISQPETGLAATLTHARKSHDPARPEIRQGHLEDKRERIAEWLLLIWLRHSDPNILGLRRV